ncbi:MAG: hypothetical protein K9H16_07880 [Bacteroidales bacterium]|nr:hypothetical protein [Bacteroidales bacterium]
MKIKTLQILNIFGLIGVLIVNTLANALPIAGKTTGELSDLYPSIFTPAGFTFSIWGIIYLLLIIFTFYQAKGLFGESNIPRNRYLYRIDIWFFVSSLANMAWIFAWHHQIIWLSMLIMVVIFGSLLLIYLRLGIGRRIVGNKEKYLVHLPFSIYLGWITVATIANASTVLIKYNWDGFGFSAEVWTSVMISTATLVNLAALLLRKDLFFSLVAVWAFIGIIYKRTMPGTEFYLSVVVFASAGIFLILATIIFQAVKKFVRKD